jgi:hypothetical protein
LVEDIYAISSALQPNAFPYFWYILYPESSVLGYDPGHGGNSGSQGECSMTELEKLREQRKHKRFFPKEWVSAFCQAPFVGIGKLVDISRGGVAFQYVQRPGVNLALLKDSLKLNLFETVTSHGVKEIQCNVVYDAEVPRQNDLSGGYPLRRCAVEFGEHNWYQSFQLEMFIKDFTVEQS